MSTWSRRATFTFGNLATLPSSSSCATQLQPNSTWRWVLKIKHSLGFFEEKQNRTKQNWTNRPDRTCGKLYQLPNGKDQWTRTSGHTRHTVENNSRRSKSALDLSLMLLIFNMRFKKQLSKRKWNIASSYDLLKTTYLQ